MNTFTYTHVRNNLAAMMDQVCADHTPVIVTRQDQQSVIMLSLEDYESLVETAYLLRSPKNAERLTKAIDRLGSGGEQISVQSLLATIPTDFTYPDDVQDFAEGTPVGQELL